MDYEEDAMTGQAASNQPIPVQIVPMQTMPTQMTPVQQPPIEGLAIGSTLIQIATNQSAPIEIARIHIAPAPLPTQLYQGHQVSAQAPVVTQHQNSQRLPTVSPNLVGNNQAQVILAPNELVLHDEELMEDNELEKLFPITFRSPWLLCILDHLRLETVIGFYRILKARNLTVSSRSLC